MIDRPLKISKFKKSRVGHKLRVQKIYEESTMQNLRFLIGDLGTLHLV